PPSGSARFDAAQVSDAVAAGLERLGLRQKADGNADLLVRARVHQARRPEQVVEPYGGRGYGYPRSPCGSGRGARVHSLPRLHLARRVEQVVEPYGGYGYGYRHHHYGWGAGPRVYSYHRDVLVMAVELIDGRTGQPVWRGQGESPVDTGHRDRLYRTAREALSGFTP